MSFGENLIALRESRGVSRKELSEHLNMPYTTLRNYETNLREPGHKLLIQLAQYFNVSVDALIGNDTRVLSEDHKYFFSKDEAQHIKKYRELDVRGRRIVDAVLNSEYDYVTAEKAQKQNDEKSPIEIEELFQFDEPVSAGTGIDLDTYEGGVMLNVISNIYTRRADYVLVVRGDSMEPKFFDGDLIMVEKTDALDVGEIGIWIIDGKGYVKKRGESGLISLNPKYDPVFPEDIENQRCSGRVIGVLDPAWIVINK